MKHFNSILAFALPLVSLHPAFASNLPNLDGQTLLGTSTVFMSPKKTVWHLATDFSAEMVCSPVGRSLFQSCVLSIMNAASVEAREAMARLSGETGQAVASITALDSRLVTSVQESMDGEITTMAATPPSFPRTLSMSGTAPYYSYLFRVKSGEGDTLLSRFSINGLGTFRSKIGLMSERVGDYLALRYPDRAKELLAQSKGRVLSKLDTDRLVRSALQEGKMILNEIPEDQALIVGASLLKSKAFDLVKGGIRIRNSFLSQLVSLGSEPFVLVDHSSEPVHATCEVTLAIKQGAKPQVSCTGDDE